MRRPREPPTALRSKSRGHDLIPLTCFAAAVHGHGPGMTDHIEGNEEIEVDVELEEDADDEQVDRAPQPGNTPAPGEPPLDSGAITGGRLADDH